MTVIISTSLQIKNRANPGAMQQHSCFLLVGSLLPNPLKPTKPSAMGKTIFNYRVDARKR